MDAQPTKPRRKPKTIADQIELLADDTHHALVSHPFLDRLQGRKNVAEAVLELADAQRRTATAQELTAAEIGKLVDVLTPWSEKSGRQIDAASRKGI